MVEEKRYYYNETRSKLISYIVLLLFFPLNIYLYNKGVYGEVHLELGFLGREFLKESIYDVPFIIILIGLLIKFIKDLKNSDNTKVVIKNRDKIIGYLCFFIISLILVVIYFKAPEFSSVATFLGMFVLVFISTFEVVRELTKQELKSN